MIKQLTRRADPMDPPCAAAPCAAEAIAAKSLWFIPDLMCPRPKGEEVGTRRSSASPPLLLIARPCSRTVAEVAGMFEGRGNCCWEWMPSKLESSFGMSDLLGAVGDARAANSFGETLTPAFANSRDASSASKGAGIGTTGKSFVEMPRCCRDMCECKELRDLATVPQSTHRYPGQTVCLSSMWVRSVWADR